MAERKKKVANLESRRIDTGGETAKAMEKGEKSKQQQTPAGKEEKMERENSMQTRGRLGCKCPRINLATTPENYQFVRVMAKISGRSITEYVNFIITKYREEHPGLYEKAVDVMKEAGMDVPESGTYLEPGNYLEVGPKGNKKIVKPGRKDGNE